MVMIFVRAMRRYGFAYKRDEKGCAIFTLTRLIGGREAYVTTRINLRVLKYSKLDPRQYAQQLLCRSNHKLDKLATA